MRNGVFESEVSAYDELRLRINQPKIPRQSNFFKQKGGV